MNDTKPFEKKLCTPPEQLSENPPVHRLATYTLRDDPGIVADLRKHEFPLNAGGTFAIYCLEAHTPFETGQFVRDTAPARIHHTGNLWINAYALYRPGEQSYAEQRKIAHDFHEQLDDLRNLNPVDDEQTAINKLDSDLNATAEALVKKRKARS